MVTTSAAPPPGGTTKLGPWTTSTRPTSWRALGRSVRTQADRAIRAGTGRAWMRVPAGAAAASPARPRHETANTDRSMSGRAASPSTSSRVNTPTPVIVCSSDVMSTLTVSNELGAWWRDTAPLT